MRPSTFSALFLALATAVVAAPNPVQPHEARMGGGGVTETDWKRMGGGTTHSTDWKKRMGGGGVTETDWKRMGGGGVTETDW
ncbi:hypothetical protein PENSPDRAFT_657561 [Peniophora sp. CONT]|nr:hypothetical protein PENSPDRAFT_657561 [Peniophora sp. CONT]